MNRLSLQDRARILGCLVEGNRLRATTRMMGCSINTVTKLLIDVGTACGLYQNEVLRNLKCERIQVDEIWTFCYSKQKNTPPMMRNRGTCGDVYTWVAIDADTKLVPSWLVGTRDAGYANVFIRDLRSRLASRVQLTSNGHKAFLNAVEEAFGLDVDYAMLIKLYGDVEGHTQEQRYSGPECIGTEPVEISGRPDPAHISTSHVERQNLTMRMSMKRFARLSNSFSKKIENHERAVALHYMHYNFGRIHKTLRVTPAMEAGVSDHVWTLKEIAKLAN